MFLTLMYHAVDRRVEDVIGVSEEAFEQQLAHIDREGYRVLTLRDVLRIVAGEAHAPERSVFLTFDDGYADNLYEALPRLQAYGWEATLFVPTAYVGGDNRWNLRASSDIRHLDWEELAQWVDGGGRVGGHMHEHHSVRRLTTEQVRESMTLNRQRLEQQLGVEVVAFSYPFGIWTPEARAEAARQYKIAFSVDQGTWNPAGDPFTINRFGIDRRWNILEFAHYLEAAFADVENAGRPVGDDHVQRRSPSPPASRSVARRRTGAARSAPRVALVASAADEPSRHPPGERLADLLEAGWDAHLLYRGTDAGALPGLDRVGSDVLRERVHPPPVALRRAKPRMDLPLGLARATLRRPVRVPGQLGPRVDPVTRYLRAVLVALDPDLVHLPSATAARDWISLKRVLRARFVVGFTPEELTAAEGHAPIVTAADGIHLENEAWGEHLPADPASQPITVIPPLMDAAYVDGRSAGRSEIDVLRIVAIGPLSWAQGYEYALHALRLLADRGVAFECRIVGRGDHEDALGFARHQLDLAGAVELVPPGTLADVWAELLRADVLVHAAAVPTPSPWLLNAVATGCPIVTTDVPVGLEQAALAVPRRDSQALADALAQLARDTALRGRLTAAGRRRGLVAESLSDQLARFRDLYRATLEATPPVRA